MRRVIPIMVVLCLMASRPVEGCARLGFAFDALRPCCTALANDTRGHGEGMGSATLPVPQAGISKAIFDGGAVVTDRGSARSIPRIEGEREPSVFKITPAQ